MKKQFSSEDDSKDMHVLKDMMVLFLHTLESILIFWSGVCGVRKYGNLIVDKIIHIRILYLTLKLERVRRNFLFSLTQQ